MNHASPCSVREALAGAERVLSPLPSFGVGARSVHEFVAAVLDKSLAELRVAVYEARLLTADQSQRLDAAVVRAQAGMPFAYAVGTAAFRHLLLEVDPRVLIPRPETELLVDHALRLSSERGGTVADIGTGSGAIALALATEGSFERVIATDVSTDALVVAESNARRVLSQHAAAPAAPVEFRRGADLVPLRGLSLRGIVANPPYIAYSEAPALPSAVRDWEPSVALFAADDGMARYRAILQGARALLAPDGWLILECDANRAMATESMARSLGGFDTTQLYPDLTGRLRVLVARNTR